MAGTGGLGNGLCWVAVRTTRLPRRSAASRALPVIVSTARRGLAASPAARTVEDFASSVGTVVREFTATARRSPAVIPPPMPGPFQRITATILANRWEGRSSLASTRTSGVAALATGTQLSTATNRIDAAASAPRSARAVTILHALSGGRHLGPAEQRPLQRRWIRRSDLGAAELGVGEVGE